MTQGQKFPHHPSDLLADMHDRVLVLTFNRQKRYNAWTEALRDELTRKMHEADKDTNIDAVVVTGAGEKAFCGGQDLRESQQTPDETYMNLWVQRLTECYDALRGFGKPLVAAINGVAAGSGFQLVQFCDYVVGHPAVRLGQTEVNSGIPSVFGTWLMWERIGSRAYELSLQGRLMGGEEAKQLGFINELVEQSQVLNAALSAARRLAEQPRVAYRLSKAANRQLDQERYSNALRAAVAALQEAFSTGTPQKEIEQFFDTRRTRNTGAPPG